MRKWLADRLDEIHIFPCDIGKIFAFQEIFYKNDPHVSIYINQYYKIIRVFVCLCVCLSVYVFITPERLDRFG